MKFVVSPQVGWYYRAKKVVDRGEISEGDLVVVIDVLGERIEIQTGEEGRTFYYDPDEFADCFEHVKDGEAAVQEKVVEAMKAASEIQAASAALGSSLRHIMPHIAAPTDGGEVTELALAPAAASIVEARSKIAGVRNDVAKLQLDVKRKQESVQRFLMLQQQRMAAIFEQQAKELAGKLGDLTTLIKKAEEAIWTINLYLGKEETIVQIAKGKPAHKDTKITIRQLVLYADEECAVAADKGGIDFTQLRLFDEWVVKPKHLAQLLPEEKGVVALKVRRHKKERNTGDTWSDAEAAKQDKKTYFLMRNGGNVYRICTSLEVGETLVPRENEQADLFFEEKYNHKTHRYDKEPVYPGDKKYMEAMGKADELKKHYLRILLFLQGLLDRTHVFAPLPAPRLNLLNRLVYGEHLVFINDAEKLLTSGKPSFEEWLKAVNSKLDVGHRIMGSFNAWSHGLRQFSGERTSKNERLSPSGAEFPDDLTLYTIEGREGGQWFFRYARGEAIYRKRDRWSGTHDDSPAKRRASCRIEPDDEFILNFDVAKVEDMEWYLSDRTNRHDYAWMFPLLKRAIELKHKEAEEEAPFRDLLARQIHKEHTVSLSEANAAVDVLVDWWKLKNMTHRALASDDAKALRMIVKEFGQRRKRERQAASLTDEARAVVEHVTGLSPDTLYIGFKGGRRYVSLRPHNDENVYVIEEEWVADGVLHTAHYLRKEWQTVERKRLASWTEIYVDSSRWADWEIDAREAEHLTDPEREMVVKEALSGVLKKASESYYRYPERKKNPRLLLVTLNEDSKEPSIDFWVWAFDAKLPRNALSRDRMEPMIQQIKVAWTKKKGSVTHHINWDSRAYEIENAKQLTPWGQKKVLQRSPSKIFEELEADVARYKSAKDLYERLDFVVDAICDAAREAMKEAALAKRRQEFLAEYEHEELWEAEREKIKDHQLTVPRPMRVRSAAAHLVSGLYADLKTPPPLAMWKGTTFGKLLAVAAERGWKPSNDDEDKNDVPLSSTIDFVKWREERELTLDKKNPDDEGDGDED